MCKGEWEKKHKKYVNRQQGQKQIRAQGAK
jgi:hypothetical protein